MKEHYPCRFILITAPRSGTMMIANLLVRYPGIRLFNLYAIDPIFTREQILQYQLNWQQFQMEQPSEISHVGTTMHRMGDDWIIRYSPFSSRQYWQTVAERHDRYICVHRKNILRRLLSVKVGQVLGTFEVVTPRPTHPGPVTIPLDELALTVDDDLSLPVKIDQFFPGRLVLNYEQLCNDWSSSLKQIQDYLGLVPIFTNTVTFQQETRKLSEAIANYDEVIGWCVNNGHEEWLD